ncbi:hypothetical protein AAFC00_005437 [Neodothiora populina]|uniref:AB hydrolase-1 domain-containing protein n=1 Tax=Neodothiora populina TaxID=2781224 RepID=A0ABR3PKV2_9PEZI
MSTSVFALTEHVLPCSYIREYPLATAESSEDPLFLAIKQYTPKDNPHPRKGDLTIIGAHANGFPKELYEPLWDELYAKLKANNIRIRSIWIADAAHQGQSGVINEKTLGNDPSWYDHSRDLFLMINHFRAQMSPPFIGVGHSMGGFHLANLALIHPSLFTTLILIDPVIQRVTNPEGNYAPAKASTRRRDRWPSREAARTAFKKSKFYQTWDPRVLDLWIDHGIRDLPSELYPTHEPEEVTLTTSKHQEVATFMRGNFPGPLNPAPLTAPSPLTHGDVDVSLEDISPFYRPEALAVFQRLPFLNPSVLYIFGAESSLSQPHLRADKMAMTGVGVGGSGGQAKGRVSEVVLDAGHLIPMEKVTATADECSGWIGKQVTRWSEEEKTIEAIRQSIPRERRAQLTDEFVKYASGDFFGKKKSKL